MASGVETVGTQHRERVAGRPPVRLGRFSGVWRPRMLAVTVLGLGLVVLAGSANIGLGDFPISIGEVLSVLLGGGDTAQQFIVLRLRLPRTLTGILVGAALGLSGAITQAIARNPLASPDILGVTGGASAAAVMVIVLGGSTGTIGAALAGIPLPIAALIGGLGTAAVVYALAYRRGIEGYRLVLVGIGIGYICLAFTSWLLINAQIYAVAEAAVWLTGSLNARGWEHVTPIALALAVLVPIALILAFGLGVLQLGDDTARGLGMRVDRARTASIIVAVGLAAVATSSAGPILFVALVVPQICQRLVGAARPPLLTSAVYGALLLVADDLLAPALSPIDLALTVWSPAMPPLATIDILHTRSVDALHDDLTRRRFLAGTTATVGLLAGCTSNTEPATTAEGPWSFTDDRGTTVTLESRPQRIVAYETSAGALLSLGVRPVGIFASTPLPQSPSLSGFDLSGIETVGEAFEEINLEKLAAVRPEVIITSYTPGLEWLGGMADENVRAEVQALAPTLGLNRLADITDTIARYEQLALSLGADLDAPAVKAARQRFDQVREGFRAAVAGKPGLLAVAVSAIAGAEVYFNRPTTLPPLRHLRQLGLALVDPEGATNDITSVDNYEFESVSFELADKYPVDLILLDDITTGFMSRDELAAIPTWRARPAVRAGQIVSFSYGVNWSYRHIAEAIERITDAVQRADPNIVP